MDKAVLLSLLVATILIPSLGATDPDPRRGLRKSVVAMALFNVVYFLSLIFLVPRLMAD